MSLNSVSSLEVKVPELKTVSPLISFKESSFPAPFASSLEYSAPARGPWTIMHLGLLVPETHIVFVCAQCCLRGVVMSAAEVGALRRFSTVTIEDNNLLEGDTEEVLVNGVADILAKLPYRPKGMLIYTSCVHEFIGSDLTWVFDALRKRFPDIAFTDCYMTPVLRKRITPDRRNRRQIYTLVNPADNRDNGVTVFGDVRPASLHSDIRAIVESSGRPWRTITATRTWDEYQALGRSEIALAVNPVAKDALEWAERTLSMDPLMVRMSWMPEDILENNALMAKRMGVDAPAVDMTEVSAALKTAKDTFGATPVVIDYTSTVAPLSLARFLITNGFNVKAVYTDNFMPYEKKHWEWLKTNAPDLTLGATLSAAWARTDRKSPERPLAIGQKSAYFTGTDRFVNMIEDDGLDGLRGLAELLRRMTEAYLNPKVARDVIQIKALGCTAGGCL